MEPSCSSTQSTDGSVVNAPTASKRRRRQEKRQKRMEGQRHMLFTKHFSNYRLPVSVASTDLKLLQLSRYESLDDRARNPPLYMVPDQRSQWARLRMVSCPCHRCSSTLDPNGWLSHYLTTHLPKLGVQFMEVPLPTEKQTLRATCYLSSLEYDVNTLLGVYGYQRIGLNPLNCPRNTLLPREYRHFSQHGILMLFACRTRHALLWQRKQIDDVIAFWVSTPLQGIAISLRCIVQPAQSARYYAKRIKARPLHTSDVQPPVCREFIKTDSNVVVISYQDLWQLMSLNAGQQLLNVELHITGEQKI